MDGEAGRRGGFFQDLPRRPPFAPLVDRELARRDAGGAGEPGLIQEQGMAEQDQGQPRVGIVLVGLFQRILLFSAATALGRRIRPPCFAHVILERSGSAVNGDRGEPPPEGSRSCEFSARQPS